MNKIKIGDILIKPDNKIIIITDINKICYSVKVIKIMNSIYKIGDLGTILLPNIQFYRPLTPLEKVKYL